MHTFLVPLMMVGALGAGASPPQSPGVAVESHSPQLTVRITQPTSTRVIFEQMCRATQARCEWDEKASQALGAETVPATVLQGTWTKIVSQLLAGINVNYATMEPADGQLGRLLVEYRAPMSADLADTTLPDGADGQESWPRDSNPTTNRPVLGRAAPGGEGPGESPGIPPPRQSRGGADPLGSPEGVSSLGFSNARVSGDAEVALPEAFIFMDQPAIPSPDLGVSPFPDEFGNPVSAREQPINGSPFPDLRINPAKARTTGEGQPQGSPFPPP
jgi:hypothetical protein